MMVLPKEKQQLLEALNNSPFDEDFIEPLFELFRLQSAPAYSLSAILASVEQVLPRSAFPSKLDDRAVGMIQLLFALRYFAFRGFNGTTSHRILTNSLLSDFSTYRRNLGV